MALDSAEEIIIPLKPLLRDVSRARREESFRDGGVVFLSVRHFQQVDEQGNFINSWCYAACAQMVFDFNHVNIRQCQIAGFVKGPQCCVPSRPAVCTEEGCDHPDITRIYDHWGLASTPHLKPN